MPVFFSQNAHAVSCAYKLATGKPCLSCGLTRSFHAFLTGHWQEAIAWNAYGATIFSFFVIQFIGRLSLIAYPYFYKPLPPATPKWDGIISLILFGICFGRLIVAQWS
jgi:hypothetical protein